MSGKQIGGALATAVLVVTLIATVGPAARAASDAAWFLWPIGVVALLALLCLSLTLLLVQCRRAQSGRGTGSADSTSPSQPETSGERERREVAYQRILATSEAYINAHRAAPAFDESPANAYLPEIEEAYGEVEQANVNFVAARQLIEQYGIDSILTAVQDLEDAINEGNCDKAATIRRTQLVPAVREDMRLVAGRRDP